MNSAQGSWSSLCREASLDSGGWLAARSSLTATRHFVAIILLIANQMDRLGVQRNRAANFESWISKSWRVEFSFYLLFLIFQVFVNNQYWFFFSIKFYKIDGSSECYTKCFILFELFENWYVKKLDHNIFDDASNIHNVSQNIVFQAVNQSIIMRVIFALTSRYKQQSALGSLIYSNSKFTRKTFKKNTHTNYQIRQINKFEICVPSTLRVSFENACKQEENSEKSESRPITL